MPRTAAAPSAEQHRPVLAKAGTERITVQALAGFLESARNDCLTNRQAIESIM
jgi:hypothetical protein